MKELSVKQKIANVLMENEGRFLTIERIAKRAYNGAYMKETSKHLDGLVKRNMSHAIALLSEEGFLVIKELEPCVKPVKMTHKTVKGYKIADKGDERDVMTNLKTQNERLEIAKQIKFTFESLADSNNKILDKQ